MTGGMPPMTAPAPGYATETAPAPVVAALTFRHPFQFFSLPILGSCTENSRRDFFTTPYALGAGATLHQGRLEQVGNLCRPDR